jgi:hypothetical protein
VVAILNCCSWIQVLVPMLLEIPVGCCVWWWCVCVWLGGLVWFVVAPQAPHTLGGVVPMLHSSQCGVVVDVVVVTDAWLQMCVW